MLRCRAGGLPRRSPWAPCRSRWLAVAAGLPLERVVLESDAPDQPPFGRDKPNEPAFVLDTLGVLAGQSSRRRVRYSLGQNFIKHDFRWCSLVD